ncbi:hypothetical protein LUW77_14395 [Streptomyces radiopugnans]|nr:hypothetical protein LUW77_14395 [Streptomyces radiopugnans]
MWSSSAMHGPHAYTSSAAPGVRTEPIHSTRTPSRRQYSQQPPVVQPLASSVRA